MSLGNMQPRHDVYAGLMLKPIWRTLGLTLMVTTTALPVNAQSSRELDELRNEIRTLRAEVDALKRQSVPTVSPAPAGALPATADAALKHRVEQLESKTKNTVASGTLPGSFVLPGTQTSLRLYGTARLYWQHDLKGDNSDQDQSSFTPYAPLNASAAGQREGRDYLTARTSRFGMEAATPTQLGDLSVKIEGDFANDPRTGNTVANGSVANIYTQLLTNSYNFRLRHAYGKLGGFLVGQTWSTFYDADNAPETVDFNGPIGSTGMRQPQIRYTRAVDGIGNLTAAIENPVSYVLDNTGSTMASGFSETPDLIARWDRSFPWGSASIRGVTTEHRLKGAGLSIARRGYGLGATAYINTGGGSSLTVGLTGGTGIGRYFYYIEGAFYDAAANRIELEQVLGTVIGYQHKYSDSLRFNAVFGAQRNFDNAYTRFAQANGLDSGRFGINRSVWQGHLGVVWNPVTQVDVGVEYVFGRRTTLADETGDTSRLEFLTKYSFN